MSNQSVIKYVPTFKKADLLRTKLKTVTPKAEELCVSFDTGGIENLLYVVEDFVIVMEALGVTDYDETFKFFKKLLGHGPAEKFRKLLSRNFYMDTVVRGRIIESKFQKATKGFIGMYCTSQDPRGDLIEYLKSDKCMKPREKSVSDHQDRMEELMRYSSQLEGSRDNLSEPEQKTILFHSFPVAWQISFKRTQTRSVQSSTVEDMMVYMNQEKEFADSQVKQGRHNDHHGGRGYGGRGRRSEGRGNRDRGRGRGGRRDNRRQG